MHRGLRELELLGDTWNLFQDLTDPMITEKEKQETVELICEKIVKELKKQHLVETEEPFLQSHLDTMMQKIEDPQIRKLHWLQG